MKHYTEKQLTCSKCGRLNRSLAGKKAHERACTYQPSLSNQQRVKEEIESFANADGIRTGLVKKEEVGGRDQNFAYDGDGVGWYGPGLEADMKPHYIKRPGQFT